MTVRRIFMTLALGCICLLQPVGALAQCVVQDRVELAKAGYSKAEIEAMCANQTPAREPAPQRTTDPVSVLRAARYDSSEDPAFGGMWHPRNQCEFLSDQIKLNNIKKTFGGYKSSVIPYRNFWANTQKLFVDRQKGIVSAQVLLVAMGILDANETCYALLDRRLNVPADQIDAVEREVRGSFDNVLGALKAMGVDTGNAHR